MRAAVFVAALVPLLHRAVLCTECHTGRVKATAESGAWISRQREGFGNYLSTYVIYDINYYCSGSDAKNLAFVNQQGAITGQGNLTTIWFTSQPHPIGAYWANCTDTLTGCTDSVTVEVYPAVTAISQHSRATIRSNTIFVPFGEHYEVVCTGTQAEKLEIILNEQAVDSVILNKTSVKSVKLHESKNACHLYYCRHNQSTTPFSGIARVYVDYPPEAIDFWCIEKNEVIMCSWKVISIDIVYKLIVNRNGAISVACDAYSRIGYLVQRELSCELRLEDPEFDLIVEACNFVFCKEQRLFINRRHISKPQPPFLLERLNTNSHRAFVEFLVNTVDDYKDTAFHFKVEYKLPGVMTHALDASSLRVNCSFYNFRVSKCVLEMILPCPNAFYKVNIYVKPIENHYWSDPATIRLYTISQDSSLGSVNAICNQKYELISNKERAEIAIEALQVHFLKNNIDIQKKVNDMKQKVAKVSALRRKLDEL